MINFIITLVNIFARKSNLRSKYRTMIKLNNLMLNRSNYELTELIKGDIAYLLSYTNIDINTIRCAYKDVYAYTRKGDCIKVVIVSESPSIVNGNNYENIDALIDGLSIINNKRVLVTVIKSVDSVARHYSVQ